MSYKEKLKFWTSYFNCVFERRFDRHVSPHTTNRSIYEKLLKALGQRCHM